MNYFENKVVWITGASSGIGEALSTALASQGAKLILSSRNAKELERVKARCPQPEKIKVHPLDLSKADTLEPLTQEAIQLFGRIDILINNGGISQTSYVKETQLSVDRRIMEVDYFGAISLTKYLLPHFFQNQSGHIVVTSSVVAYIGTPYRSSYAAAKHALNGYFDSLRAELWQDCKTIYVTIVCPGFVRTNVSLNSILGNGEKNNVMDETIEKGIAPDYLAKKILSAIRNHKNELLVGGFMELLGVYMKRFIPGLYAFLIPRMKVR